MRKRWFILIALSLFGLTSCSSVPKPLTNKFTTQNTVEASEHWGVLAQDFANDIVATMMVDPAFILQDNGVGNPKDMYIMPASDGGKMTVLPSIYLPNNDLSVFGKTFRSYLITEITKLGYPIASTPMNAVTARWSLEKVKHNADRVASAWPGSGTLAAFIGYGVYKIIDDTSSSFPAALAVGVAYDLLNSSGASIFPNNVPHTEIALTFTVSKDERILSRKTQAYYVNEKDFNHYNNVADFSGQERHLKPVKFNLTN